MILSPKAFNEHLRENHPNEMSHIIQCERGMMCKSLRQLLSDTYLGES